MHADRKRARRTLKTDALKRGATRFGPLPSRFIGLDSVPFAHISPGSSRHITAAEQRGRLARR